MSERVSILIVGTGFAGLGMAIRLRQSGEEDFLLLEQSSELGGVWRDNHYPGVACDIESHLYSFSFEPNPRWTRTYAPQREILAYLNHCADKYALRPKIRFNTGASGATFDDHTGLWSVSTTDGRSIEARVVISAAGHALNKPVYPDIPGRESFSGKTFHSARWDHSYPLAGKTVAVIGTGASAIQIIPSIAPTVGKLLVLQRTAPWVIPRYDRDIPPEERERLERFPVLQKLIRAGYYLRHELVGYGFFKNPAVLRLAQRLVRKFIARSVPDPELRAKVTPHYTMGCKRVLISNDYYPALCRDNVELITEHVKEIRESAIVTEDGRERPVDAIVYATGFEAAEAKPPFGILGRGGLDLRDAWKDAAEAYLGTSIAGFPNLFLIVGPNCGLGHSSMIFMMESQMAYILGALRTLKEKGLKYLDVRPDVESEYNKELQARFPRTVWQTGGCQSWYYTSGGRNTTLWPGSTVEFRRRTRRFDPTKYELIA